MLRIYGNRSLKTLPGDATRPTSARIRQALFNIWQGSISGCRWLDLCAGSGAMGAEALCRGAQEVVGIEQSVAACQVIRDNWQRVARPDQRHCLFRGHVLTQLTRLRRQRFQHIYFDPPYDSDLYQPVLERVVSQQLLTPTGEIAVEHNPKFWSAQPIPGLTLVREKHYGTTQLTFYALTPDPPDGPPLGTDGDG